MIYLACPYTSSNSEIENQRFEIANLVAAKLMNEGNFVFSPISQCHPISRAGGLPSDWEYWKEYDRKILSICSEMRIIQIVGWHTSIGVRGEIEIANELNIPISFIDPIFYTQNL